MASGGRKKDAIWSYFKELPKKFGIKCIRVSCNKCEAEVQGLVARMKMHFQKCSSEENIDNSEDEPELVPSSSTLPNNLIQGEPQSTISRPTNNLASINSLNSFVVRTSNSLKQNLDAQCARFIFSANLPFRLVTILNLVGKKIKFI